MHEVYMRMALEEARRAAAEDEVPVGAVIIHQGRMVAAGCLLPLTTNPNVSKTLGTRHRAAIGLTEETDAVVIVVSEEEGKISLVREGRITRDLDAGVLRTTLQQLVA